MGSGEEPSVEYEFKMSHVVPGGENPPRVHAADHSPIGHFRALSDTKLSPLTMVCGAMDEAQCDGWRAVRWMACGKMDGVQCDVCGVMNGVVFNVTDGMRSDGWRAM